MSEPANINYMVIRNWSSKGARLLNNFPALVVLGARQVGKSTFARQLGADWLYLDLENPLDAERILNNPELFFMDHPRHVILDEVQAHPEIFKILRGVIDKDRSQRGRFIITGSASFELIAQVSESLAGRVAIMEMHPLAQNELKEKPRAAFFDIFENPLSEVAGERLLSLKSGLDNSGSFKSREAMLWGGYPEPALRRDSEFRIDWYENYFLTYIQRDILALFPKLDLIKYRRVIQMLSHLSHSIINRSEIARSIEASEKSVRDYLEIIEGTYFWRSLPAFQTAKIKTTVKMPKGHFRDTGLCCFLQNLHSASELETYPRLGNLFEGFVVEEIIRGVEASRARRLQYSHFRTKAGGEIDLILEGSFGMLPIEVKYGSNTPRTELRAMQNLMEIHGLPLGLVINHSPRPSRITEKIFQIPASCLFF
ncbi:MAG: ATP-binding protein [Puniceicoccaceae bacterium]|nr:MAG: ATP-binding protein [Puniceicoccaceae bacterium]